MTPLVYVLDLIRPHGLDLDGETNTVYTRSLPQLRSRS